MARKHKRIANQHNWSDFPPELLDLILNKLSFANKFSFQGVCSSWLSIGKFHISSLLKNMQSQPPLLMLSKHKSCKHSFGRCLYNPEEKQFQSATNFPREFHENHCIGSSNGWLVFQDEKNGKYFLFNPILDAGIKIHNLPVLKSTTKIVLWSDPILSDNNNYGIVAIHNFHTPQIDYARCGDDSWSNLDDGAKTAYCDIVCRKHTVYTLSESSSVEAWDFSANIPTKVIYIQPCFPREIIKFRESLEDLYQSQFYLIHSQDELLLVTRDIGYHVRDDGLVVHEGDMIDPEHEGFNFCYLTKFFNLFKLDFNKREWVEVEQIGERVIFLGENHSVLVQAQDFTEFEKNSIYFTDNNLFLMDLDEDSGGHDAGIYNLKTRSIETLFDSNPSAVWVIPRLM